MHKRLILRSSALCLIAVLPAAAQELQSEASRPAIEQIIHQYILQHPDVLVESMRLYQERERLAQRERSKEAVLARLNDLQQDPSSPVAGTAGGVVVVEFFDYRCGYCKRVESTITKLLADHPDIQLVFKEFPILGAESSVAAKAGLAADKQGGYLKFHQALMALPGPITMVGIEELAGKQGLDVSKLKSDMESPEVQAILARNRNLGRDLGVKSTPSFVIGSELVQGVMDAPAFERLIAQAQTRSDRHAELNTRKE
jgi:protein-disulfide isomerase